MKSKKLPVMIVAVFFFSLFASGIALCGEKGSKFLRPVDNPKHQGFPGLAQRLKPDLVVNDIQALEEPDGCNLQVTVTNAGPGMIPDRFYQIPSMVGIQTYDGTKPFGGVALSLFDMRKQMQRPGGSATFVFKGDPKLTPGYHTIKVVADSNKELPEANENNNSLTKRISCGCNIRLPQPRLAGFHKDAQGRIYIPVSNWSAFPNELFKAAPYLPPCGLNKNASRTWVDIYNADTNSRLYGFCALNSNKGLQNIWFKPPAHQKVRRVYIVIKDRACKNSVRSNIITIGRALATTSRPR